MLRKPPPAKAETVLQPDSCFITPPGIRQRIRHLSSALRLHSGRLCTTARDVHKVRRNTKKLRAFLRLQRAAGGRNRRLIDRTLRHNAARLAPARDATVRLQTLQQLPSLAGGKLALKQDFPQCRRLLSDMVPAQVTALSPKQQQRLGEALGQLASGAGPQMTTELLVESLRASYRKARRLLRKARASGKAEDLHRFRRWAKYLLYQLELCCKSQHGRLETLERLGSQLGTWHDLVMLEASLQLLRDTHTDAAALQEEVKPALKLCRLAQADLRSESLRLADRCFEDKPRSFPAADQFCREGAIQCSKQLSRQR